VLLSFSLLFDQLGEKVRREERGRRRGGGGNFMA
jgi:hypothetical protein